MCSDTRLSTAPSAECCLDRFFTLWTLIFFAEPCCSVPKSRARVSLRVDCRLLSHCQSGWGCLVLFDPSPFLTPFISLPLPSTSRHLDPLLPFQPISLFSASSETVSISFVSSSKLSLPCHAGLSRLARYSTPGSVLFWDHRHPSPGIQRVSTPSDETIIRFKSLYRTLKS